jgi:large subunit ribosomal protein L6
MSTEARGAFRASVSVPVPEGATFRVHGREISAKGPSGEVRREYPADALTISSTPKSIEILLKLAPNRKQAKALLHTWEAHVRNLLTGATRGFEAKLKSVAAHFPMKLQVKDDHLLIENFLGEKHPRSAPIVAGVSASVEGEFVVLRGPDIELVGRAAATIEHTTHIRDYDPRVFQDGIYIVERAHPREA